MLKALRTSRLVRGSYAVGRAALAPQQQRHTSGRDLSTWTTLQHAKPDAILGLVEAYKASASPNKTSLSVGAYRGDDDMPLVLESVRAAERRLVDKQLDKEYLPIVGNVAFNELARAFALGDGSAALAEGRVATVQTLSGTGACRLFGALFAQATSAEPKPILLPNPSWGNHGAIFSHAGLEVQRYRYWDGGSLGLDLDGMLADLAAAPRGAAVLLHACAHNPTGVDPTREQWGAICAALKQRPDLCLFFDCAYQGFATGDAEADAHAIRLFEAEGLRFALGQSFAKNFGLYGERVGALSVLCAEADETARVLSQLKSLIRPMYSNPPVHGARIVAEVLADPALRAQWYGECAEMARRITRMRAALKTELEKLGSKRPWGHITSQIGMFCYSGLEGAQVARMRDEFDVFVTADGRISMAGVTSSNASYVAKAIHEVTK